MPDFRNLAVMARVLVGINAFALAGTLFATPTLESAFEQFVQTAAFVEPLLLVSLIVLSVISVVLARLPYWGGCVAVIVLVMALTAAYHSAVRGLGVPGLPGGARSAVLAGFAAGFLLVYFRLHAKAFSPALAEARLQALQARIRPHFLFNSLNAVLALIRRDPKRAERALEDLADLFRTLMADARQFVRMEDELALLERYADIEQLRLGDRLRISWELDAAPPDALLPPLVLQPLLENAVYHGVEPGTGVGDVLVRIERLGDRVRMRIENPLVEPGEGRAAGRAGNRMALDNIRERLALFFDAEARLETGHAAGRYFIDIEVPYKTA